MFASEAFKVRTQVTQKMPVNRDAVRNQSAAKQRLDEALAHFGEGAQHYIETHFNTVDQEQADFVGQRRDRLLAQDSDCWAKILAAAPMH
jgi:hypothetical protein